MIRILLAAIAALVLVACGGDDGFPPYYFTGDTGTGDTGTGDTGGTDPECVTDDECGEGEACVAETCRPSCASDDECSAPTGVCDETVGACVVCVEDGDCGENAACVSYACVATCETDDDCGDGETCDEGTCVESVEPVCAANATACEGGNVVRCNEDGTDWTTETCDEGTECLVEGGVASCQSTTCEPSSVGCFDAQTAWACAEDGSGRVPTVCDFGTVCDAGACIEVEECLGTSPFEVDFGAVTIGETGERTVTISNCGEATPRIVDMYIDGASEFSFDGPATPFSVASEVGVQVFFDPVNELESAALLYLESELGETYSVQLYGEGFEPETDCPTPVAVCRVQDSGDTWSASVTAEIGDVIECNAWDSFGEVEIVGFSWGLSERPFGSEITDWSDADSFEFEPDVPGDYVVNLAIWDESDTSGCFEDTVDVTVRDESGGEPLPSLHVSLTWDNGADLDHHFVHESGDFFDTTYDCHYGNMNPDWGEAGARHNPTLDVDDTDGFGPENINIAEVEAGVTYTGIVAVSNMNGTSSVAPTLTVFVDDEWVHEFTGSLETSSDYWTAYELVFRPDGTFDLFSIDEYGARP